jgi:glucosamine kinase
MELYIGIDAGGTHTRAKLVSGDGKVLGIGEAGAANTPFGLERALRAVKEACAQAMVKAGLTEGDLSSIDAGLGMAGLNRRNMLQGLKDHRFPFKSIAFASDAAIANLGAHGGGDGAVMIVGTGSIGFGRVGKRIFTIGGYGFPVSDEGSGAELGLRAIRRALWARDGRIEHSPLTRKVLDHFHGSAGEMVLDHADAGDPIAELIVQGSARRIDEIIRTLFDLGAPHCCLMGGVADRIQGWLAASVRKRLQAPLGDALDGAIFLARQCAAEE